MDEKGSHFEQKNTLSEWKESHLDQTSSYLMQKDVLFVYYGLRSNQKEPQLTGIGFYPDQL
ncbi:hypothetical protein [Sphingobacterium pedocola]|uniref:hypothetical protein n=1 Tax=Sphingobacterium pedocola TaxID=2082722 RepID=UPI0018C9A28E|nr:hypothetical protein [Sphingobacterium pedocola]